MKNATQTPVVLLGLPWDAHSTHLRGPAQAPPLIRKVLHSGAANLTSEAGVDLGLATEEGRFIDGGDVMVENTPGSHGVEAVECAVGAVLDQGRRVFALGGDHTVSYPMLRAYAERFPELSILHFDAHCDLYPDYDGDRLSHACPFARIMEEGLAQRLIQVGIRTLNATQKQQAERFGVEIIEMRALRELDPGGLKLEGPVYLSFDLDALDPAYAPGVSHREPGGLSTRQAIDLLYALLGDPAVELVGADLVEYNPTQDVGAAQDPGVTATVAAKLLKEIAGLMLG